MIDEREERDVAPAFEDGLRFADARRALRGVPDVLDAGRGTTSTRCRRRSASTCSSSRLVAALGDGDGGSADGGARARARPGGAPARGRDPSPVLLCPMLRLLSASSLTT